MTRCPVDMAVPDPHDEVMKRLDRLRTKVNDEYWEVDAATLDAALAQIESLVEDYRHLIPADRVRRVVREIEDALDEDVDHGEC